MRILLVDDEPLVLAALSRMLRHLRPEATVTPVGGGRAAVALLQAERYDMVITDMQMPVVNGEEVLACARDTHPGTVRVVLSGFTEIKAGFRSVSLAHRYLAKPCTLPELREAITRAVEVRADLDQEDVLAAVAGAGALPPAPRLYLRLTQALSDGDVSIPAIAEIIQADDALTAKVLQVANSAFFGPAQEVTTAAHAVACLGLNALQALTLTYGAFQSFRDVTHCPGFDRNRHQAHAFLTGYIAGAMARSPREREELFTLGVLHDIGKLALASHLPSRYGPVLRIAAETSRPVHEAEREVGLPSHAAVGAALLSLWGLPAGVVEAVRWHHDRDRLAAGAWCDAAAIHVADALAHEQETAGRAEACAGVPGVDEGLLECLGVLDRLDQWREAARTAGGAERARSDAGVGSGAGWPGARPA